MKMTNVHPSIWVWLQYEVIEVLTRLWVHALVCGCLASFGMIALCSAWVGVAEVMALA
jgi:hypothetical protein